ncbi:esterase-like activity of phytase family protein [Kushneria aurantia]|uniref:Esterase-like activity of phytase family protein n=1 Tax=Kushneria aurantia TaxID=504092 RepID=A0ABV6FZR2_9GAMM|nr:esterase-like activity of phytase family protein [Kushneria aurantia]
MPTRSHDTLRFSSSSVVQQAAAETDSLPMIGAASFIGMTTLADGLSFQGTPLGGLSGLVRDGSGGYLAISDDRSDLASARFYSLRMDLGDGRLDDGDVYFTDVTSLRRDDGDFFDTGMIDPEGIAWREDGTLYVSSEGDSSQGIAPFIGHFGRDGQLLSQLELPQAFIPDGEGTYGVRNNQALESLTLTPDGDTLFSATEQALVQDGPAGDSESGSSSRILQYDVQTGRVEHQYVYPTEANQFGLVEMIALDDQHLLALERNYFPDVGNTIRLYEIDLSNASDINGVDSLEGVQNVRPADKRLVADLGDYGIQPDNVEGMSLGPRLADGRQSLVLVSDNNFNDSQDTQFIALALMRNERLDGSSGRDVLVSGPGDDLIRGGADVDTVRFAGSAEAAVLTHDDDGRLTVSSPQGGSDTLEGVELLRFDDGVRLAVPSSLSEKSPGFDSALYLAANPDVAEAVARGKIDALTHYQQYGAAEGRDPNALFDETAYLEANADVAAAVERDELASGWQHYLEWGWQEGRDASDVFHTAEYLEENPDILLAGVNPVEHWLQYGQSEGRELVG